jgi:hypothetical protein
LHADKTKDLIRASQLLNRLNSFVNGECELSPAQVQAARIVIGKVIPDLKAMEHSGEINGTHRLVQATPQDERI